jgi:hypothetical protein
MYTSLGPILVSLRYYRSNTFFLGIPQIEDCYDDLYWGLEVYYLCRRVSSGQLP